MRLLHAATLKFQDFNESELPEYAILSHTWKAGEEVSFQDMSSPYLPTKTGYTKVTETCRLALQYGLQFAWLDTCCIDKTSSAELSESINSMFRWYQKARVCIVYLDDLSPGTETRSGLTNCRWLTRGWTLQELLAPDNVQFYDSAWIQRGSKGNFAAEIAEITGIPIDLICNSMPIKYYSVARRMAWASRRNTTRLEDRAYCLLGLFDVNMPLIYGEGSKAFYRLQEEIIRQKVDFTLFAWQPDRALSSSTDYCSILASSPTDFRECQNIQSFADDVEIGYSITTRGLEITTHLIRVPLANAEPSIDVDRKSRYVLRLGQTTRTGITYDIGVYLRKIGTDLLMRETNPAVAIFPVTDRRSHRSTRVYKLCVATIQYLNAALVAPIHPAFHIPIYDNIKVKTESQVPGGSWDHRNRICFTPSSRSTIVAYSFVASVGSSKLDFGVLFDFRRCLGIDPPRCLVIDKRKMESRLLFLVLQRNLNESMDWINVLEELPVIAKLTDRLVFEIEDKIYLISVSIGTEMFDIASRTVEGLAFDTESNVVEWPVLNIDITEASPSVVSNRTAISRPPEQQSHFLKN
ncbi:heterokaryon incompatibility protein-domain-containing protein [Hypomontagnella monticulosa]|nr:heterokaryon incompatibility protein-domain-containing protein [Hypomontagnella monticulosa]